MTRTPDDRRNSLVMTAMTACAILLTGCGNSTGSAASQNLEPSASCQAAFDTASSGIEALYATHPFYGEEYDALYADGEISADEQMQLDAWTTDEEAQYSALNEPLYDACEGTEGFYAGAYAQGDRGDWSLEGNESISTTELKEIFISTRCRGQESRPACSDYEAAG